MQANLRFYGAAREVTGSMHLLEANGHTIALDCGLFQGKRREAEEKNRQLPCRADKISAVVLSHAHIDHCGKLPKLVREGFSGPIYATPATRDLAEILLADSAHIQEEDAHYWNKKRVKRGDAPIEPLYTAADVEDTVPLIQKRNLDQPFEVVPGVQARYHEAGHMLGSAGVTLEVDQGNGKPTRIVFTGDLGRPGTPILRNPATLPECDYLIAESTYGARTSYSPEEARQQLGNLLVRAVERGGKIVIPAFAVGRTQVIVYAFHRLLLEGRIAEHIPVIVDSPLAVRATQVFKDHPETYDREAWSLNHLTGDILDCPKCEYTQNVQQSKDLNHRPGPMVIISASGMCEAGRILHHLKNNIEDPRNSVLIVGYQAAHTLGRRLIEKEPQVRIFGEMYDVKAHVKAINGFSSHANTHELIDALAHLNQRVKRAFLVHGELDQAEAMATNMRQSGFEDVVIPERNQRFTLD